ARLANRRTSPAVKSVRTAIAWPMSNDPPFATLNHAVSDSKNPQESNNQRFGIRPYSVERVNSPAICLDRLLVGLLGGFQPDKLAKPLRVTMTASMHASVSRGRKRR